jgi:hypothetical protein
VVYEAQFLESVGAVFRQEAIDACLEGSCRPDGSGGRGSGFPEGWPSIAAKDGLPEINDPFLFVSIGIDWGRVTDWTAVAVVCGTTERAYLIEVKRLRGMSYVDQVEAIRGVLKRYPQAAVTCDSTGVGVAVADIWKSAIPNRGFREFSFGSDNRRELIERLVSLFERAAFRFRPDPVLQAELRGFRWKNGKPQGVGEHDDVVMALGMACYVLPRNYGRVLVGDERSL